MTRFISWVMIWFFCMLISTWALIAIAMSGLVGSGRRGWNLAVAYDRLGNVAAGGSGTETFSARCWSRRDVRRYAIAVMVIDWVFLRFDGEENHCKNAWTKESRN